MNNYATQYCAALSQQYANVLHFGALFARKQEGDYRWVNAHTIEIPTVTVTGRVDADRDTITGLGSRTKKHSNTWTPLALTNHRMWEDLIHPLDINETNQVLSIANITRRMNEDEKFPEKDRYLISKLYADWITLGRVPLSVTLSTQNILEYFDMMMVMMTERNVPATGRILYITPTAHIMLNNAISMYRNVPNVPAVVNRAINGIDSVAVEEVPSANMKTVYDFTQGSVVGASAKQIQMFLVHPTAVITPEQYEFAQLSEPSAITQGKWLYYEESYDDVFILPNKQYGLEFLVDDLAADTATFTSAASTDSSAVVGDCKITMTAPVGDNVKPGTRYFYKAASGTAPTAVGYGLLVGNDWIEWDGKNTTVLNITNALKATILVTDADRRVYASGNGTITSKT